MQQAEEENLYMWWIFTCRIIAEYLFSLAVYEQQRKLAVFLTMFLIPFLFSGMPTTSSSMCGSL